MSRANGKLPIASDKFLFGEALSAAELSDLTAPVAVAHGLCPLDGAGKVPASRGGISEDGAKFTAGASSSVTSVDGVAIGIGALVTGSSGVVVGRNSDAGDYGVAFGHGVSAQASCVAIGFESLAYGPNAVNIGGVSADGNGVAVGAGAMSSYLGTALGYQAYASTHGIAIGANALTNTGGSVAIGGGVSVTNATGVEIASWGAAHLGSRLISESFDGLPNALALLPCPVLDAATTFKPTDGGSSLDCPTDTIPWRSMSFTFVDGTLNIYLNNDGNIWEASVPMSEIVPPSPVID